jgi:hypothetical protein
MRTPIAGCRRIVAQFSVSHFAAMAIGGEPQEQTRRLPPPERGHAQAPGTGWYSAGRSV